MQEFVRDLAILLVIGGALFGYFAYNSRKNKEASEFLLTDESMDEI